MYNETLRKITSLSLLTILLTSTAAFAMPNALPQAHASTNANLFVSAENSQFKNYFAGPQVVQVIVSDPDIQRLDQVYGEPIVTLNGKRLRMAQGTDGNWYGYFADRDQAIAAANTAASTGKGLNFGGFCSSSSTTSPKSGVDFSQTKGFTVARGGFGSINHTNIAGGIASGGTNFPTCTSAPGTPEVIQMEHVVRENKTINMNVPGFGTGATIYPQIWPVIQLYDFGGAIPSTNVPVTVDYSKAGGDQVSTLTFSRIPQSLVTSSVDRPAGYPANSQVFITLNDPQLNIDPTEEDSWTWGANATNSTLYYMAFTRNGAADADGTKGMQNLIGNLTTLMFDHNGKFTLNPAAQGQNVVDFQANSKEQFIGTQRGQTNAVRTNSIGTNSAPITFIESGGVNTGVFASWDGSKKSDIVTSNTLAIRGQSATTRYNDVSNSIVGTFGFGTLSETATNGTWHSGQKIPITLVDTDANLNSKLTEHRDLFNPVIYQSTTGGVPAMTIGTPFSLANGATNDLVTFIRNATAFSQTGIHGLLATKGGIHTSNVTASSTNADTVNIEHIALVGNNATSASGFQNATTGLALTNSTFKIFRTGGIIIDSGKKMSDLLNTVHNDLANDTEKFRGFNFINYDLRSLATNATGSLGNVGIYLITNPAGTGILTARGHVVGSGAGFNLTSIANSTSLQDLINLNGTALLGDKKGSQFTPGKIANGTQITVNLFHNIKKTASVGLFFNFTGPVTLDTTVKPIAADFFSVGIKGDGVTNDQRINNAVYRWELQETGDNTSTFTGTTEYVMLNQLNIFNVNTYSTLRTIAHEVKFVAIQDMLQSESRAPQSSYEDVGGDGQFTILSAQVDVPTHTGVVSFDSKTYKIADTVTITLNDADLNVDNDLVDIYTVVTPNDVAGTHGTTSLANEDVAADTVGKAGLGTYSDGKTAFGRLLDIQFGQQNARWANTGCFGTATTTVQGFNLGLFDTGFSLVETGPSTGIFKGTFEIPDQLCDNSNPTTTSVSTIVSAVGQNIKVNYVDFRDQSGKKVEVSDNAGVRGNTGSITLDKSVYPVPFGSVSLGPPGGATTSTLDFSQTAKTSLNGVFPLHRDDTQNGLKPVTGSNNPPTLTGGDTIVHIRVNDQDYNLNSAGTDHIAVNIPRNGDTSATGHGPVWATISRQGVTSLLTFAGGPSPITAHAVIVTAPASPTAPTGADASRARDLGPMTEIDPASGIFQADLPIRFTDGPAANDCPTPNNFQGLNGTYATGSVVTDRFDKAPAAGTNYCVRQGDVLTVYYNDTNDASGHQQIVTDSATFDLRNGVLQSDKSVYIIGSDMILTLVEPDLNLDSQQAESVPLDLVEWDSHAFKGTMGPLGLNQANFDAKPSTFVETGKDTGIFQSVIKIPKQLSTTGGATGTLLERGEQIHLEYTDWGPAGSKTVGKNNQDIELTIYTSNFGATVELDQKVYTWTDRVYITVVAPDHNFDPNLIDTIGNNDLNKVTVSTRGNSINQYQLTESGVDTGIFTGYVILTGSKTLKDAGGVDGAGTQPTAAGPSGIGPTDGFLPSEDSDGVSVSFEFTRDQTVTGSALIRWNIGEIKWLQASYPANGQGVLQIVDPDMNLNPKAVDKFDTNVWSDSDSGGIKLTMTETGEATGIFQGTVYFTTNFQSSGNRLHVAEGDTVTGEYKDRTLPAPYTPADQLRLTSTTFIGTVVPPLERAPASNPRIVDSFGNALTSVKVNQQIQVTADLTNGQDRSQPFAYLVQIQDANGVTVSLSWITGTLTGGQSLNPAQSWTPTASGTYTAQIFVWQSIDNPNALSPPLSTTITVA